MADYADRYRNLSARLTRIADQVAPDAWDLPSPCEGWSARDVLAHLVTTQWDFVTRFDFGQGDYSPPEDPLRAWPEVRDRVQALLDDPQRALTPYDGYFGPTNFAATIDQFYATDLLVHAWDIARAAGLTDLEAMPADEVRRCLADINSLGDAVRQPGVFGPPVSVPDEAGEQARLLAFTGREP
jgi:uncharacterized protein (TIGR03086 family)